MWSNYRYLYRLILVLTISSLFLQLLSFQLPNFLSRLNINSTIFVVNLILNESRTVIDNSDDVNPVLNCLLGTLDSLFIIQAIHCYFHATLSSSSLILFSLKTFILSNLS